MAKVFYIKDRADLERQKKMIWRVLVEIAVKPFCINITDVIRNHVQNRKMWPMLADISKQKKFNGELISTECWKHLIVSGWLIVEKQETPKVFMGIEGEVVTFNTYSTSRMGKKDFCCLIEYIYAYGSTAGVVWSEKASEAYDSYKEVI